jgi:parallel beta-helix repeat protein
MKMRLLTLSLLLVAMAWLLALGGALSASAHSALAPRSTIIVTSRTDSGAGSLRMALLSAIPGDHITFDPAVFPPSSPATITLLSALPEIAMGNLTIDASNAGVILDGRYVPSGDGIRITSSGNTIKGLQIVRFPDDGIEITNGAKNNTIGGDWTVGSAPRGEGNIITLNKGNGVNINGTGTNNNTVIGNLIGLDADGTRDLRVQAMALSPNYANDQTLFIGTRFHGVWKTTDGGSSWSQVSSGLSISDVRALAISPNYASDQTLFAGTTQGGIFKTTNAGTGWTRVDGGVTSRNIQALAISPVYTSDGHIFAATEGDGVFGSTNGGAAWSTRNGGLTNPWLKGLAISPNYGVDRTLFAITWDRIFKSINQGYAWNVVSSGVIDGGVEVLTVSPNYSQDQTLFAGAWGQCQTTRMFWKSTDGGSNWQSFGTTENWCVIHTLVVSPNYAADQTLFVGTLHGVFKSSNGGTSWLSMHPANNSHALAISPAYAGDQTLFVGQDGGSIYRSVNGGSTWTEVSTALSERGNYNNGVTVGGGAQGNVIGGDSPGKRNVVSHNGQHGISINGSGTTNNIVIGNYIGTDASGIATLGNGWDGLEICNGAQNNRVGGTTAAERNVISGNRGAGWGPGLALCDSGTMNNTISGNYLGTDASGTVALENRWGVGCWSALQNIIESNVISGNEYDGIHFNGCSNSTITSNYIGSNAGGTANLGNGTQGIVLFGGSKQNTIGTDNIIAYNKGNGIEVRDSTTLANTITRNSIHSNSGMGIYESSGGNTELSPPALVSVTANSVSGIAPMPNITIEIFSDDENEGRIYEGTTTADASGNFSFTKSGGFNGPYLTATSTDTDGNTSEFSAPVQKPGATPTPTRTATPTRTPTPTPTPTSPPPGAPVITSITPNSGADNQITYVTIAGANFVATPTVSIGTTPLTGVSLVNSSQLLAAVPAGMTPGTYDVRVCNPNTQCATLPNGYTVTGTGPTLLSIAPNQGFNDTPNDVALYGYNLQSGIILTIGSVALQNVTWVSVTQVRAVVPTGLTAGSYDVVARNPGAPNTSTLANGYTALDPAGDDLFAEADDIWTSPMTIRQGESVSLGVNVHRQGGKTTLQPQVSFYLGNPALGSASLLGRILARQPRGTLLGTTTTPPMPPGAGGIESAFITWNTTGLSGAQEIYVVIDPSGAIPETSKTNNTAHRTVTILPAAPDTSPPLVTSLQINGGADSTTNPTITLTIAASDTGGSGVATMYLVEREFNSSARQWVAVQRVGWIPFQSPYQMTLTGRGGVRYIQVWVADNAGNITVDTYKVRIDYVPTSDTVRAGQVRVYRRTLAAGQSLQVTLETLSGDADLYVWRPDGNQSWVSNNSGTANDSVSLTAPQGGTYQIEVYGYQDSTYRLTIVGGTAGVAVRTVQHINQAKPERGQPVIAPTNEPAGNSAVPPSPIGPTENKLYLPIITR